MHGAGLGVGLLLLLQLLLLLLALLAPFILGNVLPVDLARGYLFQIVQVLDVFVFTWVCDDTPPKQML